MSKRTLARGQITIVTQYDGIGAPNIECDRGQVVMQMDSEGFLSDPGTVDMPGNFRVIVDGEAISPTVMEKGMTYVKYKGRKVYLGGGSSGTITSGWRVSYLRENGDAVGISWIYGAVTGAGSRECPTEILIHVRFTYRGRAMSAERMIPVIENRMPAVLLAEYSVTGSDGTWHQLFQNGDIYARYSNDGGRTWTPKIRIVGKSLEFKTAYRHFATWPDYLRDRGWAMKTIIFLVDRNAQNARSPFVVAYRSGILAKGIPDYENVTTAEPGVNYFTREDGHLWVSNGGGESWADMGKIQGENGRDGVSFVLSPSMALFEQDMETRIVDTSNFVANVIGMRGNKVMPASDYAVNIGGVVNCTAYVSNRTEVRIRQIEKKDNVYRTSGSVIVKVTFSGTAVTLTLNWAANLLGTWKQTVKEDIMQAVSEKTISYTDSEGNIHTEKMETLIEQNASGVSLSAKVNDLERAGVHLDGKDSRIDLLAERTRFLAPTGLPFIKIGTDTNGVPYLVFMMPDGVTPAYNLGYTGLTQVINNSVAASFGTAEYLRCLGYLEDLLEGIDARTLYNACNPSGMPAYYRFTQTRLRQSDGTMQLIPVNVNVDGKYYDSMGKDSQNLPTGRDLNTCSGKSGIEPEDYTIWIGAYLSQDGWENKPELFPQTSLTRNFILYYVRDSRIVKSVYLTAARVVSSGHETFEIQPVQSGGSGIFIPDNM